MTRLCISMFAGILFAAVAATSGVVWHNCSAAETVQPSPYYCGPANRFPSGPEFQLSNEAAQMELLNAAGDQ